MKKAIVSIICCLALSGCSHFPCEGEKGPDRPSPNHQLTATVVYIGCGAISKDGTWVTLHRTGEKHDRSDDIVFTADPKNQAANGGGGAPARGGGRRGRAEGVCVRAPEGRG